MSLAILVPGAAGPAGINTIKSLRMANVSDRIVATDSSDLAAGFFLADDHMVMPEANAALYKDKLFQVVKDKDIKILMPSSGYDVYPYSENRDRLHESGAVAVVSDRGKLETCRDKALTFKTLSHAFKDVVPFTTLIPEKIRLFPIIAKPRFGKGSRDIFVIKDQSELDYVKSRHTDMIYQELLPGTEYTVDVLSDLSEKPLVAVPRIRLQTKAGISTKGKVVHNPELENLCMKIAEFIGIRGPCCIQMKESAEGVLKLVEINPRMGGGTIFTALAGINFPKLVMDLVFDKKISIPAFKEVTVLRYFNEIVLDK